VAGEARADRDRDRQMRLAGPGSMGLKSRAGGKEYAFVFHVVG
jgi:hypothetical protein